MTQPGNQGDRGYPYGRPWISAESFWIPNHRIVDSGWVEHAPFASWLIANLQPQRVVELGTHNGYSYFAMCEVVKRMSLSTEMNAIDTWEGDDHAGFYGEDVYELVSRINSEKYASFSKLLRGRFDEHVGSFADGSVDLLHIDGRHGLEDVTEDFESWVPKLSENAVVLFHDITVHEREFGVWQLWEQLQDDYENTFGFEHGNGLGVLAVGSVPEALRPIFDADDAQQQQIRDFYAERGGVITSQYAEIARLNAEAGQIGGLVHVNGELQAQITGLQNQHDEFRAQITGLQNQHDELVSSTTWKVTQPLRTIVDKARGKSQ